MGQVQFKDRADNEIVKQGLTFVPIKWSGSNKGGYRRATIEAYGSREKLMDLASILRYETNIFNDFGKQVWNGFVNEVIIYLGNVTLGFTLSGMTNRVKVIYNTNDGDAGSYTAYTDWFANGDSIAKYGYMERVISVADTLSANAEKRAQQAVANLAQPVQSFAFGGDNELPLARIECLGWYSSLKWRMFRELRGSEGHSSGGSGVQRLGVGFTSNNIGFNAADNSLRTIGNQLHSFPNEEKFIVTNSVSNDGSYTAASANRKNYASYSVNASFSSDDVFDADELMAERFEVDDMVKITDSSANNGFYFTTNVIPGKFEVTPFPLTTEAENPVTIEVGSGLKVDETVTQELPSLSSPYNVTILAAVQSLAREFTAIASGTWKFKRIRLRVRKEGAPADNLQVSLASNSGSHVYTIIESATVSGSNIPSSYGWIDFEFSGSNTITGGNDYAVIISRTGTPSTESYYEIAIDEDSAETGVLFSNDSINGWESHANDADLIFTVIGEEETTTQIANILEYGQFIDYYIELDSGVSDLLYMANYETVQSKLEKLLAFGATSNVQLVIVSDLNRNLYIRGQQTKTELDRILKVTLDGQIKDSMGNLLEDGELVFDQWITLDDTFAAYGYSVNFQLTYITGSEWDDSSKTLTITSGWESSVDKLDFITNG